jgi:hypothetical protein
MPMPSPQPIPRLLSPLPTSFLDIRRPKRSSITLPRPASRLSVVSCLSIRRRIGPCKHRHPAANPRTPWFMLSTKKKLVRDHSFQTCERKLRRVELGRFGMRCRPPADREHWDQWARNFKHRPRHSPFRWGHARRGVDVVTEKTLCIDAICIYVGCRFCIYVVHIHLSTYAIE